MRTLTADGEAASHSGNVADLRTHYSVSFARRGAPYHPHHNGPVETMVKLLKTVVVDMGRLAGLSIAAHWPLLMAHAAYIINVMPRVSLQGRSARAALDGSPPNLRHFRTFGCAAVILAVGSYKNRGLLAPPGVMCEYIGVGLRRNMPGAMFILSDGRTVVSQHYRLDETKFSGIPSRRPPGVAAFARVLPADDPYDVGFVPPSVFVVFGAAPCTAASGTVVDGEAFCAAACYSPSAFMCMHVQRRRPSPADVATEGAARVREISNLISICTFATYSSPVLPLGAREVPWMHVLKLWPDGTLKLNAAG
jgi:hypothetical protein